MFFDERINAECGKMYQRGILYATILTAFFGALRAVELYALNAWQARYLLTELTIVISGIVILLIGLARFGRQRDERVIFEKHRYYLNAGKAFLLLALSGYVIYVPFSLEGSADSMPPNQLILMLESLGCIYFFYHFKNKGINFNYSFIEQENYYGRVFANIGKMAGILAIAFSASLMIDFVLHHSIVNFLVITLAYLFSVLGLGAEYLFISWVERVSYHHENEAALNKGTLIALIAYLIIQGELCSLDCVYYAVMENGLQLFDSIGEVLAAISMIRLQLSLLSTVLWSICLCCFMTQIKKSKLAYRAIRAMLILSAISIVWTLFLRYYVIRFIDMIMLQTQDTLLFHRMLTALNTVAYLMNICSLIFLWIFVIGLIAHIKLPRGIITVPVLQSAAILMIWFLQSQNLLTVSVFIQSALTLSSLIVLTILLNRHSYAEAILPDTEAINQIE